ncbi:MAG: PilZ domain-containing protein [Oleiphilus sp.]
MSKHFFEEKRLSKRYLCDDFFVHIVLHTPEGDLCITAIDFNQEGMGFFSNEHIPEMASLSLSLQYKNPPLSHTFTKLPCSIVYCNQTEVGSHCGTAFTLNELSEADKKALEEIEAYLITCDDPEDRYHLFGDD